MLRRALIAAGAWALLAVPALAYDFSVPGGGGVYSVSTQPYAAKRFVDVVRQNYDFSCGSAALATLLTYHYDLPVDEMAILSDMYAHGEKEKIHKEGFSLLDMKKYLERLGLKADGYRESLDKLSQVGVPAIVLVNRKGYSHFVVVKGLTKHHVLVGDPSAGLRLYSRAEFESSWNRILFVILDMKEVARARFNPAHLWADKGRLTGTAQVGMSPELGNFTLSTIQNSYYY